MSRTVFILGDADRVREKVEGAIFGRDLGRLSNFSNLLTNAILSLVRDLETRIQAYTVMAGGDDVLFTVDAAAYDAAILREVADRFASVSGCTISFGVGITIEAAYLNLRKAKSAGGGIVESDAVR